MVEQAVNDSAFAGLHASAKIFAIPFAGLHSLLILHALFERVIAAIGNFLLVIEKTFADLFCSLAIRTELPGIAAAVAAALLAALGAVGKLTPIQTGLRRIGIGGVLELVILVGAVNLTRPVRDRLLSVLETGINGVSIRRKAG